MLKYLFRVISVFISLIVICLTFLQLEENETEYPWHTQSNISLSFSSAQGSKQEMFRSIDRSAQQAGTTVYLIKSDMKDAMNGTDLFWFGRRPVNFLNSIAAIDIPYFKPERHGLLKKAAPTMTQNLSGTYAVPTNRQCLVFQKEIRKSGGTIVHPCMPNTQSKWHVSFDEYSIMPLVLCALALLGSAVAWAWIGLKPVSQKIRRLAGFSPAAIAGQDCASFMSVFVLPAVLAWLLACAIVFLWRAESRYPFLFATISGGTIAMLLASVTALAFLFSLCLQPRISQISARRGNETLARYGSNCYKVVCLAVVLAAVPVTALSTFEAVTEYKSAAVWRNVTSAVGIQTAGSASQADEARLWNVIAPRETQLYHEAARRGAAALSYTVSNTMTGSNSGSPDAKTAPAIPGGYDDIVLTDRNFLSDLHISPSDLSHVPAAKLDPALAHTIREYDGIWLIKGSRASLTDNLYEWKGSGTFPAIAGDDSMGAVGTIKNDKNPLIILVDDPSQLGRGITDSAFDGSNIFFTNRKVLDELIDRYGLSGSIESVTSVADSALSQAQGSEAMARHTGMVLVTCLLVIVFTSIQSASIWARQRRRLIFVLCSSGQPIIRILRGRLLWDVSIAGALGIGFGFFDPQWKLLIARPAQLLVPIVAVYLILEIAASWIAVRTAFVSVVRREE